jgi:hypothetical protein
MPKTNNFYKFQGGDSYPTEIKIKMLGATCRKENSKKKFRKYNGEDYPYERKNNSVNKSRKKQNKLNTHSCDTKYARIKTPPNTSHLEITSWI